MSVFNDRNLGVEFVTPDIARDKGSSVVNIVEGLLTREALDALELDLACARVAADGEQLSLILAQIAKLETALMITHCGNPQSTEQSPAYPRTA